MNEIRKIVLTIALLSVFSSCTIDNSRITAHAWLFGAGFWIGDWLTFEDSNYRLSNDTIYKRDTAVAVIVSTTRGYLGADNEIEIQSIKTGRKGTYHEK